MTMWDGQQADPEQHMVLIRHQSEWVAQARQALEEITEASGGREVRHIIDARAIAPVAFGRLVEAMHALGIAAPDLVAAAGLIPVDQALL